MILPWALHLYLPLPNSGLVPVTEYVPGRRRRTTVPLSVLPRWPVQVLPEAEVAKTVPEMARDAPAGPPTRRRSTKRGSDPRPHAVRTNESRFAERLPDAAP
jgi:hypothetical protein